MSRAQAELATALADAPETMPQRLAEAARALCRADAAGVRYRSADGAGYQSATCGHVTPDTADWGRIACERNIALHFSDAGGFAEALSAPVRVRGSAVGALWIAVHAKSRRLEAEDLRILECLSSLAAAHQRVAPGSPALSPRQLSEARRDVEPVDVAVQHFLNSLPGMAWVKDELGRYAFLNENSKRRFHIHADDWLGKTDFDVLPHHIADAYRQNDEAVLNTGIPTEVVEPSLNSDGTHTYVISLKFPLRGATGRRLVCGLAIDVTELKRAEESLRASEERLRLVLESSGAGAWSWDAVTDTAIGDERYAAHYGISANEPFSFAAWIARIHPQDKDRLLALSQQLMKSGADTAWDVEFRALHPTRGVRWMAQHGRVERDSDGRAIRYQGINLDITEHKWAADAMRASALRLDEAQRIGHLGSWDRDIATGHEVWSSEQFRIFGYEPNSIQPTYDTFLAALDPEDRSAVLNAIEQTLESDKPYAIECRIHRPDGEVRHVVCRGEVVRSEGGTPVRLVGTVLDVTDRRRAEEAVRTSEEWLRVAIRASHIGLWDWKLHTNEVYFSPLWKSQLGYRDDEIPNRYEAWESRLHPDDRESTVRWLQAVVANPQLDYQPEFRLRHRDGSYRWIFAHGSVTRDDDGKPVRMIGCHVDVTEHRQVQEALREREARLASVLSGAADAIITIDHRGMIDSVNPAAERLFGYTPTEMIDHDLGMLLPAPDAGDGRSLIERFASEGLRGVSHEAFARRKGGGQFPVDLTISEIGSKRHFTVILRDATRRKQLERQVVEIASLEQRRIGEDLHDSVGQELTALSLRAGDLTDAVRKDRAGATRLAELISQGLRECQTDLRAVIRGLLPVPVDAEGLMAALADLADRTSREHDVECRFDCPSPVSVADNLTATHLYLIAQEAVHNAVKHARPSKIRIVLKANSSLVLKVEDNGIGMRGEPAAEGGVGLRIMENRAAIIGARLSWGPCVPTGTCVKCELSANCHV